MISIFIASCTEEENLTPNPTLDDSTPTPLSKSILDSSKIAQKLDSLFELLPEKAISTDSNCTTFALYTNPTERYPHGIMGDKIEGGQLIVQHNDTIYSHLLPETYVFEDIRPRIADLDQDGEYEFVTIRSHKSKGGGIAIYKIIEDSLQIYSWVEEIGTANRWLNIAAIDDLDNDGDVEIAWVQTPHIGGILKAATFKKGKISPLSDTSQLSNHAIGERNLCLSVLTRSDTSKILSIPNQSRDKIVRLTWEKDKWVTKTIIEKKLDFSQTLLSQFDFKGIVIGTEHCIDD